MSAEASHRTRAALHNGVPDNVPLPPFGQELIFDLMNGRSEHSGSTEAFGPEDVGALTVLSSHLKDFVGTLWINEGQEAGEYTFWSIRTEWLEAFMAQSLREVRAARGAVVEREDVADNAMLLYAYQRARELVYLPESPHLPQTYMKLLAWHYEQFQMLQAMDRARVEFRPATPAAAQIGPQPDAEEINIEELPDDARQTLQEVPALKMGDALHGSSKLPGRRVDAGRPFDERATIRVASLPTGSRAGEFRAIHEEEPPPASDDDPDVA